MELKVFLIFVFAGEIYAKCKIKVEPGMPNRTLCSLDNLEDHQLKSEKTPDFLYLDVSYGEIPKDTFQKMKSKKELWFLGENITYIQPGAFKDLPDLDNLAITNTLITNISARSFTGVPNLKILSLIKNKIDLIEDGAFEGLPHLQQLLLNQNQINRINETTFRGLDQLQALYLDDNPIEYIHVDALRRMRNLTRLVISLSKNKNVDERALDFLEDGRKTVHYVN